MVIIATLKKEEYVYWHMVVNIYPKAKRLMKSNLKNGTIRAFKKQMDVEQFIKDDETGDKMKFHDLLYLGKTLKNESPEIIKKQVKQYTIDLKNKFMKLKKEQN